MNYDWFDQSSGISCLFARASTLSAAFQSSMAYTRFIDGCGSESPLTVCDARGSDSGTACQSEPSQALTVLEVLLAEAGDKSILAYEQRGCTQRLGGLACNSRGPLASVLRSTSSSPRFNPGISSSSLRPPTSPPPTESCIALWLPRWRTGCRKQARRRRGGSAGRQASRGIGSRRK